ncbi:MAG: ATP-binding protein [candidate division KSB1 bacterium]|nr:ATP-binding protein [candidate division KSB1 bacterium]
MKRYAEGTLKKWLANPYRKPLIIRGARQVGKSTLVRNFAQDGNLNLIEVNLEKHLELDVIFKTFNIPGIIREIEGLTGKTILAPNSLLFLDEIQATPWALQALRYFYEEYPQLPVIAAGSLLEFALSRHNFSMPVGRIEYLYLGPMTFEEFLLEKDSRLLDYIHNFDLATPLPQTVHKQLLEKQREFLFIGGMPEAIFRYIQTDQLTEATSVHQSIIETYKDDFSKYVRQNNLIRLHRVFNYVPSAVGEKVKYSNISRDDQAREIKIAVDLLTKAGLITPVYHSSCSGIPLNAQADFSKFKLLFVDVGLMNRVCGLDWLALNSMDERKLINEGSIAEQFIGQHLLYLNNGQEAPSLHYWIREQKTGNAEVDYVISRGDLILPVEVKSGKSGSLKSLFQFVFEKHAPLAIRFDLNLPSIQKVSHKIQQNHRAEAVEVTLISLPIYLVGQLNRLIDRIRKSGI